MDWVCPHLWKIWIYKSHLQSGQAEFWYISSSRCCQPVDVGFKHICICCDEQRAKTWTSQRWMNISFMVKVGWNWSSRLGDKKTSTKQYTQADRQPGRQTDNQTVRQADRLADSRADRHPGSRTETWIVEGDQDVGWGLLLCSSLAVYDGEGHPLGLGDVITHAACGVDDEAQHRSLGQAHQPGPEQSRGAWI